MKILGLVLLGYFAHFAIYEIANINCQVRYKDCLEKADWHNKDLSPYQQCKAKLHYNSVEELLLYQPEVWTKF